MSTRVLQDAHSSTKEGFSRHAVCCPVCEAGRSMVAMKSVGVDQGAQMVTMDAQATSLLDKVSLAAVPTPIVDLHFACFAGHSFTLRFLPEATGGVLMTVYLEEPDSPVG